MKELIDIIKKEKALLEEEIVKLNIAEGVYFDKNSSRYDIHTFEYLFKLSLFVKQSLLLDKILDYYYSQEGETQFANIHVGKEV